MEHINGGVINYDSGQNDCVFMNLYLAAKLPVNRSFFHDYRGSAGNSIRKDFGISRYMDVSMDITRGYDSMIFYDGFSTDSAFSGNDCTTTSAGVIPHDGVTGYIGFLGGDSIVRNPALPFLTEIFLRLDETAKISRMVVTMGGDGSVFVDSDGHTGIYPGRKVDIVDTTGAGDAFFSGVCIGLTYGKTLQEACRIGTRLAATVICTTENICPRFMPEEFGLTR